MLLEKGIGGFASVEGGGTQQCVRLFFGKTFTDNSPINTAVVGVFFLLLLLLVFILVPSARCWCAEKWRTKIFLLFFFRDEAVIGRWLVAVR